MVKARETLHVSALRTSRQIMPPVRKFPIELSSDLPSRLSSEICPILPLNYDTYVYLYIMAPGLFPPSDSY